MSCSLYRWTEECEGQPCVGDCDLCRKETMIDKYDEVGIPTDREVEADGFITRVDDLEYTQSVLSTARLSKGCIYPNCEKCGYYREHYCTVPMVVSKQIYRLTDERIRRLEKELAELKELVYDEIFGSSVKSYTLYDKPTENPEVKIASFSTTTNSEEVNFTWDDYLGEDK